MHHRHGVCSIVDRVVRTVGGHDIEYLVLDVHQDGVVAGDLTLMISVDEAETQLRPAADEAAANAALAALRDQHDSPISDAENWRAVAARGDRTLAGDDLVAQARLLRDLERDDEETGLSSTLARLRDRASRQLAGEIAVALDCGRDDATERIETALASARPARAA